MHVDCDDFPEAGRAGVDAGVRWLGVLHHQEAGGDLALLRDDRHTAARGVVRNYLKNKVIYVVKVFLEELLRYLYTVWEGVKWYIVAIFRTNLSLCYANK